MSRDIILRFTRFNVGGWPKGHPPFYAAARVEDVSRVRQFQAVLLDDDLPCKRGVLLTVIPQRDVFRIVDTDEAWAVYTAWLLTEG